MPRRSPVVGARARFAAMDMAMEEERKRVRRAVRAVRGWVRSIFEGLTKLGRWRILSMREAEEGEKRNDR